MNLRVLSVCYEDPAEILGGMGMHVRELFKTMAARGAEIDLLTDSHKDGSEQYLGFTKHYSDKLVSWKPRNPGMACLMQLDIQMARKLARLIASGKRWDVIHCHEWNSLQIAKMARDALGIPMVGTMHLCLTKLIQVESPDWTPAHSGEGDLYMMQQEGALVCEPERFIVASHAYERIIREQFMTARPIDVIPNGIDTSFWHPGAGSAERAKQRHGLNGRDVALFVGRIATMKGIVPLIDAIEQHDSGYTVVVAGEVNANSKEDVERWEVTGRLRAIEAQHPERLRWVGFQHGDNLRDLYEAADVCLMPSIHEPFGIVALEAMASGTPLIATEVDGLGEVVKDGESEFALIIPDRSPRSIIEALGMARSSNVRHELSELGLKRASQFSWAANAEATERIYQEVMSCQ